MKQLAVIVLLAGLPVSAQDPKPEIVTLRVAAASAEESNALRLLPASPDLKDGNAAVVMLRTTWEQANWMQKVWPKLGEVCDLPHDDPKVQEIPFDSFQRQLYRAAMMKDAHWEYPINSEPLASILLPDVQGFRQLAGRGMKIWIAQQIVKGDLHRARQGILTQFACARHIAETPFLVTHLVANAITRMGLDRAELLIQQPDAPNLYWAFSKLPPAIGPVDEAIELESRALVKSLPALDNGVLAVGSPKWKEAAVEFSTFMSLSGNQEWTVKDANALKKRLLTESQTALRDKLKFDDDTLKEMSDEEKVMRWVMLTTQLFNTRTENAFSLPAPDAIRMLVRLDREVKQLEKKLEAPSPLMKNQAGIYMSLYGFGRRVKFLQTVEAIRDHMSQNDGQLPKSLDDVALPIPNDPFTNTPFEYRMSKNTATLKMTPIEGVKRQQVRHYRIMAAKNQD